MITPEPLGKVKAFPSNCLRPLNDPRVIRCKVAAPTFEEALDRLDPLALDGQTLSELRDGTFEVEFVSNWMEELLLSSYGSYPLGVPVESWALQS